MGNRTTKVIPLRRPKPADDSLSAESLVAACSAGDPEALALLFDRYGDDVARFLSRLTYVNPQDIGDLVQEVFLAAFRGASRFRRQSCTRTWLFAIGANIAKDAARKDIRFRAFKQDLSDSRTHTTERSIAPQLPDHALRRRVLELLSALPHDLRVAFVMCDLEEISGVEAARVLGIPEGTLYRRLHEARRSLREAFKEQRQ